MLNLVQRSITHVETSPGHDAEIRVGIAYLITIASARGINALCMIPERDISIGIRDGEGRGKGQVARGSRECLRAVRGLAAFDIA